jgi:hypothetical protein
MVLGREGFRLGIKSSAVVPMLGGAAGWWRGVEEVEVAWPGGQPPWRVETNKMLSRG